MYRAGSLAMMEAAEAAMGHHPPVILQSGIWYFDYKHGPALCCGDDAALAKVIAVRIQQT